MVSIVWSIIAFSTGLLIYLLPPALAPLFATDVRVKVGNFYYKQAIRSFRQLAIVRRMLSGYELFPINLNDKQRLAEVTLSSSVLSDDNVLQFGDPDNRLKRLFSKPVAVVPEIIPAAVDAELSELGHHVREKKHNEGLYDESAEKVDPHIITPTGLHVSDPMDVMSLIGKSIKPENIETSKQLTRKRFDKYGADIGMAETLGTLTGFAVGIGGVALIRYMNAKVLNSTGGGGGGVAPAPPIPLHLTVPDMTVVVDMAVMFT